MSAHVVASMVALATLCSGQIITVDMSGYWQSVDIAQACVRLQHNQNRNTFHSVGQSSVLQPWGIKRFQGELTSNNGGSATEVLKNGDRTVFDLQIDTSANNSLRMYWIRDQGATTETFEKVSFCDLRAVMPGVGNVSTTATSEANLITQDQANAPIISGVWAASGGSICLQQQPDQIERGVFCSTYGGYLGKMIRSACGRFNKKNQGGLWVALYTMRFPLMANMVIRLVLVDSNTISVTYLDGSPVWSHGSQLKRLTPAEAQADSRCSFGGSSIQSAAGAVNAQDTTASGSTTNSGNGFYCNASCVAGFVCVFCVGILCCGGASWKIGKMFRDENAAEMIRQMSMKDATAYSSVEIEHLEDREE